MRRVERGRSWFLIQRGVTRSGCDEGVDRGESRKRSVHPGGGPFELNGEEKEVSSSSEREDRDEVETHCLGRREYGCVLER